MVLTVVLDFFCYSIYLLTLLTVNVGMSSSLSTSTPLSTLLSISTTTLLSSSMVAPTVKLCQRQDCRPIRLMLWIGDIMVHYDKRQQCQMPRCNVVIYG